MIASDVSLTQVFFARNLLSRAVVFRILGIILLRIPLIRMYAVILGHKEDTLAPSLAGIRPRRISSTLSRYDR